MDRKQLEEQLAQTLVEGEMKTVEVKKAALKKLPQRTEIRIQSEHDPVKEETKQYRQMAEEIDDRYDRYADKD